MVNARYFTNVGEFIIKSLCLYWDFQYSWEYQSVYEFYGFGYAPDSVYRFQFFICRNVYRNSIYDYADF